MKKQISDKQFLDSLNELSPTAKFKEAHSDEFGKRRMVAVLDEILADKIIEARNNKECFKTLEEIDQEQHYHCQVCGYVKGKLKGLYFNHRRQGIKYSCRICNSYIGTDFTHQ